MGRQMVVSIKLWVAGHRFIYSKFSHARLFSPWKLFLLLLLFYPHHFTTLQRKTITEKSIGVKSTKKKKILLLPVETLKKPAGGAFHHYHIMKLSIPEAVCWRFKSRPPLLDDNYQSSPNGWKLPINTYLLLQINSTCITNDKQIAARVYCRQTSNGEKKKKMTSATRQKGTRR